MLTISRRVLGSYPTSVFAALLPTQQRPAFRSSCRGEVGASFNTLTLPAFSGRLETISRAFPASCNPLLPPRRTQRLPPVSSSKCRCPCF
ncbi:hypothetical protein VTG60DRAFT_6674 [Thermothelomyces hinnuleus]